MKLINCLFIVLASLTCLRKEVTVSSFQNLLCSEFSHIKIPVLQSCISEEQFHEQSAFGVAELFCP